MLNSLKSRILIFVLGILTTTTVITIFFVYEATEKTLYSSQIENAENLAKTVMLNVENEYQSILFHKNSLLEHRKDELKNVTDIVFSLIESYYSDYRNGNISENRAKLQIISLINRFRYDKGTGYFWINDTGYPFPKMIVHPTIPDLNGEILDNEEFNCAYGRGVNLFSAVVDICSKTGEGYVDYLWPKPSEEGVSGREAKISYVKLFKEWDWIIGSGVYIDDIDKDVETRIEAVLRELKETFSKIKFAQSGYMFVFNSNKDILIHPFLEGENRNDLINPVTAKPILDEMIKASENPEVLFEYYWDKPDRPDEFQFKKVAYINYFKPLDWYIASSIYVDEIKAPLNKLSRIIILLSILFLSAASFLSVILSRNLTKPLNKLMLAVHQINNIGKPDIVIPVTGTNETKELGLLLQDMIKSIKNTNEQLMQAQKMETVGTLAGGLAHDFNNMLGGIIGSISLMDYKLNRGSIEIPELKKHIETMKESGNRASILVSQLLSLSRKQELNLSNVDLNNSIKNVIKICESSFDKSVKIIPNYLESPAVIKADPTQIEQALLNFCVNAEHSMTIMRNHDQQWGGKILISLRKIRIDSFFKLTHPEAKEGYYYNLSVKDSGVGMDSNTISKMYNPFFTTKEKGEGSGLGLSMVYNIIIQHGGFIDVYSELETGTSFHIYLPVLKDYDDNTKTPEPAHTILKGNGVVLVIDDEELMRNVASEILRTCGYDVLTAENGFEGIDLYRKNKEKIKVILLDMAMPKMSGKEAYIRLKEINPDIKVILSSGFQQDKRVQDVLKLGVNSFIQKPYTLEILSKAVDKLLTEENNDI